MKEGIYIIILGLLLLFIGYFHVVYIIPKRMKNQETTLRIESLKSSFLLIIFGCILILLGVLLWVNLLLVQ